MTLTEPTTHTASSYHKVDITTTPHQLIEICKERDIEYHEDNSGTDKTNFDFSFYVPEKDLYFTVYDWKHYESLDLDRYYSFHIGAKDMMTSLEAKEILLELLNNNN